MPGTFDGFEIVGQTKNFLITCADDPGARQRGQAILTTCEADLSRLEILFGTNFQTGETHDYSVWVNVFVPVANTTSNGSNYGFESDESSRILITNAYVPAATVPGFPPDPPAVAQNSQFAIDEFPRFVFIAELAEILMDFTGYGWGAGASNGEGLSNLLGALLHPVGYYGTGQGPRVDRWLNGIPAQPGKPAQPARPDWISKTEGTDKNIMSYGCSILFINYLVSQLGHDLGQVIRAGGNTLADTYSRVTGNPAAQAFSDFQALIEKHLPTGKTTFVAQDNVFPLRDAAQRSVGVNEGDPVPKGTLRDARTQSFQIKPGLFCPPEDYDFFVDRSFVEVPEYAFSSGFLNAAFQWSANGVILPTHNAWDSAVVPVPLTVKQPDRSVVLEGNSTKLQYYIRDSWNRSALFLKNTSVVGNCSVPIRVLAIESAVNDPSSGADDSVDIVSVVFVPGDRLSKDRRRCNPFLAAIDNSIFALSKVLTDIKNRPDPPADQTIRVVLQAAQRVEHALLAATESTGMTRDELVALLNIPGALHSTEARIPDSLLNRIRPAPQPVSCEKPEKRD